MAKGWRKYLRRAGDSGSILNANRSFKICLAVDQRRGRPYPISPYLFVGDIVIKGFGVSLYRQGSSQNKMKNKGDRS